jgi:hypothetical protein
MGDLYYSTSYTRPRPCLFFPLGCAAGAVPRLAPERLPSRWLRRKPCRGSSRPDAVRRRRRRSWLTVAGPRAWPDGFAAAPAVPWVSPVRRSPGRRPCAMGGSSRHLRLPGGRGRRSAVGHLSCPAACRRLSWSARGRRRHGPSAAGRRGADRNASFNGITGGAGGRPRSASARDSAGDGLECLVRRRDRRVPDQA